MITYTLSPIKVNIDKNVTTYTREINTIYTNGNTWKEVVLVDIEENDTFDFAIVSIYDAHKITSKILDFEDITDANMYALNFLRNYKPD